MRHHTWFFLTPFLLLLLGGQSLHAFYVPSPKSSRPLDSRFADQKRLRHGRCWRPRRDTSLFGGTGRTSAYRWREEQYEIDVTVTVPPETRAKNIVFKATSTSIDLRLRNEDAFGEDEEEVERVLLDGTRQLRGRVSVDGTYWAFEEDESSGEGGKDQREVTVTIEKFLIEPKDDLEPVEYDWGGPYASKYDDEILEKSYDEPEDLDVEDYAASVGVDLTSMNMSLVDRTMFSSELNMTQKTLDEITNKGYVREVTEQADGKAFVTNEEGGAVPFDRLGEGIGDDEIRDAERTKRRGGRIPFVDTSNPWRKSVPVEDIGGPWDASGQGKEKDGERLMKEEDAVSGSIPVDTIVDPIDGFTSERLQEILQDRGLETRGTRKELQDRLKEHMENLAEADGI